MIFVILIWHLINPRLQKCFGDKDSIENIDFFPTYHGNEVWVIELF